MRCLSYYNNIVMHAVTQMRAYPPSSFSPSSHPNSLILFIKKNLFELPLLNWLDFYLFQCIKKDRRVDDLLILKEIYSLDFHSVRLVWYYRLISLSHSLTHEIPLSWSWIVKSSATTAKNDLENFHSLIYDWFNGYWIDLNKHEI